MLTSKSCGISFTSPTRVRRSCLRSAWPPVEAARNPLAGEGYKLKAELVAGEEETAPGRDHHRRSNKVSILLGLPNPARRSEIGPGRSIGWLDITAGKFYDWRERLRLGGRAQRLGSPRFLAGGLGEAGHHRLPFEEPLEGYRRLTS